MLVMSRATGSAASEQAGPKGVKKLYMELELT